MVPRGGQPADSELIGLAVTIALGLAAATLHGAKLLNWWMTRK